MADVRYEERMLRREEPRFATSRTSCIVAGLDGDLICAWSSGAADGSPDTAILAARLRAGGWRWSTPQVIVDTPELADSRPTLLLDPYSTLWLFYVTRSGEGPDHALLQARTSGDNGHTWDPAPGISFQETPGWISRSRGLALPTQEVILPLADERDGSGFLLASTDSAHWELRGEIRADTPLTPPSVIELGDGRLVAYLGRGSKDPERRLWRAVSRDRGFSWSRPERERLPNPGTPVEAVRLHNGHLVLAFNNSPTDRSPLSLALSPDEGRNWRQVRDLESGPGEFTDPSILQTEDGAIHVTYTYQHRAIKHVTVNEEWIRAGSGPGGRP
jgi:predicted neuraminidase